MQILIYSDDTAFSKEHFQQIAHIAPSIKLVVTQNPTVSELHAAEILLPMHNFGKIELSAMPNLKWVHIASAGANGVVEKLRGTEILLTNSSGVHPIPIAEQIFSYMLVFARGIHKTTKNQSKKIWGRDIPTFELHGKTIAIIGLGRIGEKVAQLAKGFEMTVLAVKTRVTKEKNVDEVFELKQLLTVLKQADFVVNCLPGTEETKGVFGLNEFKQMKPTAYFINIGRGTSVVEEDLIQALQEGVIAGAGLDVFEQEPLPTGSTLWSLENVIITPHTAGKTPEYMNRVVDIFCDNLKAYLTHKKLPNEVDKEKGY